jgi:hypothetical protein
VENELRREIAELREKIKFLSGEEKWEEKPSISFSKANDKTLKNIVSIKKHLKGNRFDSWLESKIEIDSETERFLQLLIERNSDFIDDFNEEDLKANLIIPLLNYVDFWSRDLQIRPFYGESLFYENRDFILNGNPDFFVSKGLFSPERPIFFIQEFKRSEDFSNPRPQLLAEMVAGLEISEVLEIKGAYIIGEDWYFVILEKFGEKNYNYYVSDGIHSKKIEDLKTIFKALIYVKKEILKKEGL